MNRLTNLAVEFIKPLEVVNFTAKHLKPYRDSGGKPTIGWGTTFYPNGNPVKMSDPPITLDEANEIIKYKVNIILNEFTKYFKVSDSATIALCSLAYNIGLKAFLSSTLLQRVKNGANVVEIEKQFFRWVFDGGVVVKGLQNRRLKEIQEFKKKI